jgi:hypothetical protein
LILHFGFVRKCGGPTEDRKVISREKKVFMPFLAKGFFTFLYIIYAQAMQIEAKKTERAFPLQRVNTTVMCFPKDMKPLGTSEE